MEQVKYVFHGIKSFVTHHKTLSLFIACFMLLDISLVGVIADIQQKQSEQIESSPVSVTPTVPYTK